MKTIRIKSATPRSSGSWPVFLIAIGLIVVMIILKLLLDLVTKGQ